MVVDIDDDLDALPKGHPYRAATSPTRERRRYPDGTIDDPDRKNRLWLREACRQADLVTDAYVSSEYQAGNATTVNWTYGATQPGVSIGIEVAAA